VDRLERVAAATDREGQKRVGENRLGETFWGDSWQTTVANEPTEAAAATATGPPSAFAAAAATVAATPWLCFSTAATAKCT